MATEPFVFGPFWFNPGTAELRRDGTSIPLGQRSGAILHALLEAGGRPVNRNELIERAWPDTIVEDGNLTVQVAALRKLLGEKPGGGEWISTIPRTGYRFARPQKAPAARPALAVLPFQDLSKDLEQEWFADGIVSEIITALARFRSFSVVSRNSTSVYKGRSVDIRRLAEELGVGYVLEGSVRRADDRLRIGTQLIDGETGLHLWSEHFEGVLGDVFEFQDRITAEVATTIAPLIEAAEITRSHQQRPRSLEAYDLFLRALSLLNDESLESNTQACLLLGRALAVEPNNAVFLTHAAWGLEHRSTMGWPPFGNDDTSRCVEMARRGLMYAAGDPRLMAQCGMSLLQTGKDYEGGMHVIRTATAANPYDLHVTAIASVAALHCGDMDEAWEHMERGIRLAPRDPDVGFLLTGMAMIQIIRGEYEAALISAGRSLAFNASFDATYWMLIAAIALLGRVEEAKEHLAELLRLAPGVTISSIRAGQPAMYPDRICAVLDGLKRAGMAEI